MPGREEGFLNVGEQKSRKKEQKAQKWQRDLLYRVFGLFVTLLFRVPTSARQEFRPERDPTLGYSALIWQKVKKLIKVVVW